MTRLLERRSTAPLPGPAGRLTPPEARALALLVLAVAAGVALVLYATAMFIQLVR
jgi:4-hydroxybenzoate polyprenyltransferase